MGYSPIETALMITHGLFGTCVVLSGAIALLSGKGGRLHRCGGKIFSVALCLMFGVILATALFAPRLISSLGIIYTAFACYLVLTSSATVRTRPATLNRYSYLAPILACLIGIAAVTQGTIVLMGYVRLDDDIPVVAFFVFGGLAFFAAWGDFSVIRQGGATGTSRLARHLWRMCFVLYMSIATLFTGPGSIVFPEAVRGSFVLVLPELSVLVAGIYWLVRVFRRKHPQPV